MSWTSFSRLPAVKNVLSRPRANPIQYSVSGSARANSGALGSAMISS